MQHSDIFRTPSKWGTVCVLETGCFAKKLTGCGTTSARRRSLTGRSCRVQPWLTHLDSRVTYWPIASSSAYCLVVYRLLARFDSWAHCAQSVLSRRRHFCRLDTVNDRTANDELARIRKKRSKRNRSTISIFSQAHWGKPRNASVKCPGRDANWAASEYKSTLLPPPHQPARNYQHVSLTYSWFTLRFRSWLHSCLLATR
jgi:hypothetical protein